MCSQFSNAILTHYRENVLSRYCLISAQSFQANLILNQFRPRWLYLIIWIIKVVTADKMKYVKNRLKETTVYQNSKLLLILHNFSSQDFNSVSTLLRLI